MTDAFIHPDFDTLGGVTWSVNGVNGAAIYRDGRWEITRVECGGRRVTEDAIDDREGLLRACETQRVAVVERLHAWVERYQSLADALR